MSKRFKPLTEFPAFCSSIWDAVLSRRLPVANDDDPCGHPSCQYLNIPDRRTCETTRGYLVKYRSNLQSLAASMPLSGKLGSLEREISEARRFANEQLAASMLAYSVSPRNLLSPLHRKFGSSFYKLPDGPHRIYFIPRGADINTLLTSQIIPLSPSSLTQENKSPAQAALEFLGLSSSHEAEENEAEENEAPNNQEQDK